MCLEGIETKICQIGKKGISCSVVPRVSVAAEKMNLSTYQMCPQRMTMKRGVKSMVGNFFLTQRDQN